MTASTGSWGHSVTVVDRDPEEAEQLVEELRGRGSRNCRSGRTWCGAAQGGDDRRDVLSRALEIARDLGDRLAGKVVVDIANPLNQTFEGLATAPGTSAAEELAESAPSGTRVVKAFNIIEGQAAGQRLDVFLAGDGDGAKETVAQLVRGGGLRAIDVGPLERTRHLEGLGVLGLALQQPLGLKFQSACKLIS